MSLGPEAGCPFHLRRRQQLPPVGFFKDLFAEIYGLCAQKTSKHRFRFKCKLYSMDATVISLRLSLFPWATFRKNKAGVKINTVLDVAV